MRFLFPFNPLNEKEADGPFRDEMVLLQDMGMACSLFDYDVLAFNEFKPKPPLEADETVIYRGWMMAPDAYAQFVQRIEARGARVLTSLQDYVRSHHLVSWYESCRDWTAETVFFQYDDRLEEKASQLGWEAFFVKDYVKSNYDERGSIAQSPAEVVEIAKRIEAYRGVLEGGVAVRRVENYQADTEQRFFVLHGKAHAPDGDVPELVKTIAKIHQAPFYSIDTIVDENDQLRLVELGDGQVSDRKSWDVKDFCKIFTD